MTGMQHITDPKEFKRFHEHLTRERQGYTPWYFLLVKGDKDPVEGISWKQIMGRLSFDDAVKKMRAGYNIGIAATGMDALCIVDVDDIEVTPDEIVKATLSTRSRKRIGRHYFYFTDDPRCKVNLPTGDKGEIRSNFQYVVAPGSYVLCDDKTLAAMPEDQRGFAGRYTIENARAPADIVFSELPPVFIEQARINKNAERESIKKRKEKAEARKNKKATTTDKNNSALWDLSMEDVVGHIPSGKDRFPSLFHSSDTGKNTSETDSGGLSCWRHLVTHTPLSALCVIAGITDCLDAGQGHNGGKPSGIDYDDGATVFRMWLYAKQQGMIPKDDPIPSSALVWYATEHKTCDPGDIIDGWKITPDDAYNKTIDTLEEKEGVPAGRGKFNVGATEWGTKNEKPNVLDTLTATLEKKLDTFDIVEALQEKAPIIYDSGKQFWAWSKESRMYEHIDEIDVLNALKNVMGIRGGTISPARTAYLQAIKMTGREMVVKPPKKTWVAFSDGVIDIATGERFEATKEYFFTNTIPHKIGDNEETPTIDRLFVEWVGEEHKQMLYEIIAYCLYNHYPIHRAFLLFGSGRNGKGQFINMAGTLLGEKNITSSSLELLLSSRFESTKLYQKKACFMGETNYGAMNKTNTFKLLVGDDFIGGEFKGGKHFDFKNHAKLIIATNSIPPSDDKTEGFGSKWVIVDFPNKFEKGIPIIDTIPDWEYDNLCRKSVRILRELLERGSFTGEGDTTERTKIYEEKSNPIQKFIDMHCTVQGDLMVPLWKFYEHYDDYQKENRLRNLTKNAVSKWLKGKGFDVEKENLDGDNWVRIYGLDMRQFESATQITRFTPTLTSSSTRIERNESWGKTGKTGNPEMLEDNNRSDVDTTPQEVWARINSHVKRYGAGANNLQMVEGALISEGCSPEVVRAQVNRYMNGDRDAPAPTEPNLTCDVCGMPFTDTYTEMHGLGAVCDWCQAEGEYIFARLPRCTEKHNKDGGVLVDAFVDAGCVPDVVDYCITRFAAGHRCFMPGAQAPAQEVTA